MQYGGSSFLVTTNYQLTPVPPFPVTAADNGLSVDPVSGHIVWGSDIGTTTGQLLSDREIAGAFAVALNDNNANFGIGLNAATLTLFSQVFVALKRLINQTSGGASYSQMNLNPTTNNIGVIGLLAHSVAAVVDLAAGSYAASPNSPSGALGGVMNIQNTNNTKTNAVLSGVFASANISNRVNIRMLAMIDVRHPQEFNANGGTIVNEIVGVLIDAMSPIVGLVQPWGIKQEGTDPNLLRGRLKIGGTNVTTLASTDPLQVHNAANGNLFTVRATTGIETSAPLGAAAPWKLGNVVVAPVVVDATQYVEVNINGTIRKLVIAV